MSDYEDEPKMDEPIVEPKPKAKARYKSDKDPTKRREQAIANLAKARLAKSKKKEQVDFQVDPSDDESSFSDSSDELILTTKRDSRRKAGPRKQQKKENTTSDPLMERLAKIEEMMLHQVKRAKKASKRPIRQTIVQVPQPTHSTAPVNPRLESTKRVLLDL